MNTINTNIEIIDDEEVITLAKSKSRAIRRKNNIKKAIRKRSIANTVYHFDWYKNLHQYSKNKIHCSCPMCSFNNKKKGYVQYPMQDLKRFDSMDEQEREYYAS